MIDFNSNMVITTNNPLQNIEAKFFVADPPLEQTSFGELNYLASLNTSAGIPTVSHQKGLI